MKRNVEETVVKKKVRDKRMEKNAYHATTLNGIKGKRKKGLAN